MTSIFYIRAKSMMEVTFSTVLKWSSFCSLHRVTYMVCFDVPPKRRKRSSETSEPNIQHIHNSTDDHQRKSSRPQNMTTDNDCSGLVFLIFPTKNCQILCLDTLVIGRLIPQSLQLRAQVTLACVGSCPKSIECAV